ncbi:DUF3558 domain-containing protein [Actinokineospora enzanensis]|uniref:DUF3558 domain-containing protein n=1 Tax=Actinokineospora enzanensis TaxID=155975 RepID=UPI00039B5DC1|nr:DUF3558 domain-containing protein [Actinokineospora enzanensis]
MRVITGATVAVLLTAAVAACSTSTPGSPTEQPNPQPTTGAGTTGTSTRTTKTTTPKSPLAGLDPCKMLNDSDRSRLGLSESGAPVKANSYRGCQWKLRGTDYTTLFDVAFFENFGVREIPDYNDLKDLPPIGGRTTVQVTGLGAKNCAVTMEVTAKSAVSVVATTGVDEAKACETAHTLATLVEPKLPR